MRKSWRQKRMERIKARCSAAGRRSQVVQSEKRLARAENGYELVRTVEIKRKDGSVAATWRVFATRDPRAPLAVDFGGELHRYLSIRRLSPLLARKMMEVAG